MLVLGAAPALAQTTGCPPPNAKLPAVSVSFDSGIAETAYFNDQSRAALSAKAGRNPIGPGAMINTGLTVTKTHLEVTPQVWYVKLPDGRACAGIGPVKGVWKMNEVRVDVADKYRPGSCEYQQVLAHEEQHVLINRRAYAAHLVLMKDRLNRLAASFQPMVTSKDLQSTAREISDRLMVEMRKGLNAYNEETTKLNAAIDTRENYQTITARCDKW